MTLKNPYTLLFPFLLVACSAPSGDQTELSCQTIENNKIELPEINSFSIALDTTTSDCIVHHQAIHDGGKTYLLSFHDYGASNNPQTIGLFDISEKKFIKRIHFAQEGANSFLPLVNFYARNLDSIFLVTEIPLTIYLTDTSGVQKQKWQYPKQDIANGWYHSSSPYFNKNLSFYAISTETFMPDNAAEFLQFPFIGEFDLGRQSISKLYGQYPSLYHQAEAANRWYPWLETPTLLGKGDSLIVSFPISETIQLYRNGEMINNLCLSSENFSPNEPISKESDTQQNINFHNSTARFEDILWDPYRKLFIRVLKESIPVKNKKGTLNKNLNSKFHLLFTDELGNCLGQADFLEDTYNYFLIIPVKEGLLISKDNEFNPENDEDQLEFSLFAMDAINRIDRD